MIEMAREICIYTGVGRNNGKHILYAESCSLLGSLLDIILFFKVVLEKL